MVFQQWQQQPGLLTVTGCSPQARCSAQHATSTLSLPFQRITPHSNLDSTVPLVINTVRQRACTVKPITRPSALQGIGDDVSAMPTALYIISVCLPGWGAALFLRTVPELWGLFCRHEVKKCLHLPWVQDSESSAPLPRVGTTLRHKLPSRAPAAGLG